MTDEVQAATTEAPAAEKPAEPAPAAAEKPAPEPAPEPTREERIEAALKSYALNMTHNAPRTDAELAELKALLTGE